ncbi:MAG TPA: respiratory nitrate reductase subunit gamma, partial [Jiangellaceae bacterium]|nr:respiratory nitrate reductase subunit gamma [Jiangellaceae bacterium]
MTESVYHTQALVLGAIAGFATLTGIAILIYRRRTTGPVFMATTRNDKSMYVVLAAAIVTGLGTTLLGAGVVGEEHNYRETVSPWFRSIFMLQPDVEAMSGIPLAFALHTLVGMLLFAVWPFTRLVHAFTVPVGYLFRPYIVYRSRSAGPASRRDRRGWDRISS